MSEHTEGKVHAHGLVIHIETPEDVERDNGTHTMFCKMAEEGTAYQSRLDEQEANGRELEKRWNAYADDQQLIKDLAGCLEDYETALLKDNIPVAINISGHDGLARHSRLMMTVSKAKALIERSKK